ncbi:MAG: PAS domain S-box protein [Pyrinomonadaceae bacterium]|nr:PAS domain S-box protein [Pyrinomonadaceae bacterium]
MPFKEITHSKIKTENIFQEKESNNFTADITTLLPKAEKKDCVLTQTTNNAVIVFDKNENIVSWNNEARLIFGYSEGEVLNRSLRMLMPPAYREAYRKGIEQVNSISEPDRVSITMQLRGLKKDGGEFPMEFSLTARKANGNTSYISIIRETGKQAETALSASEELNRHIIESSPHDVKIWKREGRLTTINRHGLNAIEIEDFGSIADTDWLNFWKGDEYDAVRGTVESAHRGETKRLTGYCPTAMLDRGSRHLETALEASSTYTWTYEPATNRVYADKNLAQLFSVSPEDAQGGQLEVYLSTIHCEDRARVAGEIDAFLDSGGGGFESEYRIVQPDGSFRWVVARAKIERDATGAPIRMPVALVDITDERKAAEKALIENEERLRQAQKLEAIGTLTGGVAHDFNNLLTTILVNTQIGLRNTAPGDSMHNLLTEIQNAGNRAAALTRQLLAFSRRQKLEPRPVNLNKTIGDTINLLKRLIGADVEIFVNCAPDLATVFADPAQIEQVVMNLAVNSRDAMPNGGKLFIETCNIELDEDYCRVHQYVQPGKYVQIKVKDTGEGIDEETQKRIFEPFFTTKETGKGTGLGLSIIYGIIKQHDGHISVHSKPKEGATFLVFLPAVEQCIEPQPETMLPVPFGGTETILFAEDEDSLRNVAVDILKSMGYTVLSAKNGEEAVSIFTANQKQINLLLFDVAMPRMGGYEAYRRIRRLNSEIPLIFMTGYNSETVANRIPDENQAVEELNSPVLQKPYSIEDLGHKVREVLDKNSSL